MKTNKHKRLIGLACGINLFTLVACVVLSIYLTGGTFGYRCKQVHPEHSVAFDQCVKDLADGKKIRPE